MRSWERVFKGQDYGRPTYKHKDLPVYITDEFNFYRCLEFNPSFYGRTASELFNGNLRVCTGRYSKLFPNQKLSYWANSPQTARAEIKKHGAGNDILTFFAYDDGTSTIPTLPNQSPLVIIDGRECGAQELIDKIDNGDSLSESDIKEMNDLLAEEPDCLAYNSHAYKGGENYIFFEKGFKKLALNQLSLCFGRNNGGSYNRIVCTYTSDFMPIVESYGYCFEPKARVRMDESYLASDEYHMRKKIYEMNLHNLTESSR